MSHLKNKVCFLTGGSSGIGFAIAQSLIKEGIKVFLFSRNEDKLQDALQQLGPDAKGFSGNVASESDVKQAFEHCRHEFGQVDILINNAGIGIPSPALEEASLEIWQQMIEANATGTFLCSREALKEMKSRRKGHILNIVSMAGQRTNPGAPLYCASKFAARGISSGFADQILQHEIKVTDINPGPVDTPYWGTRQVPREKFLKAEDVAEVVRFVLALPEHVVIREINFDSIQWLAK